MLLHASGWLNCDMSPCATSPLEPASPAPARAYPVGGIATRVLPGAQESLPTRLRLNEIQIKCLPHPLNRPIGVQPRVSNGLVLPRQRIYSHPPSRRLPRRQSNIGRERLLRKIRRP